MHNQFMDVLAIFFINYKKVEGLNIQYPNRERMYTILYIQGTYTILYYHCTKDSKECTQFGLLKTFKECNLIYSV